MIFGLHNPVSQNVLFRFLEHQRVKKSSVWIQITSSSSSSKSKLTAGTRWESWAMFLYIRYIFWWHIKKLVAATLHCTDFMPPEAVELVSTLLQYSPNLRCTVVSVTSSIPIFFFLILQLQTQWWEQKKVVLVENSTSNLRQRSFVWGDFSISCFYVIYLIHFAVGNSRSHFL